LTPALTAPPAGGADGTFNNRVTAQSDSNWNIFRGDDVIRSIEFVGPGTTLNQQGDLVGIPIGRMQGDYRFSFILPIRAEMLRKVPLYEQPEAPQVAVAEQQ
jgi:hypothetical protein